MNKTPRKLKKKLKKQGLWEIDKILENEVEKIMLKLFKECKTRKEIIEKLLETVINSEWQAECNKKLSKER